MWEYKDARETDDPECFQCLVTVSVVSNVANSRQNVPDKVAQASVTSVELQGRYQDPPEHKENFA